MFQQLDLVSPFQLYFNPILIVEQYQVGNYRYANSYAKRLILLDKLMWNSHYICYVIRKKLTCIDLHLFPSFVECRGISTVRGNTTVNFLKYYVELFQIWRLITTFLFFGNVGFNLLFNMIFTYRYCRMLEEGSFRRRTADFVMMFIFGGICMIVSLAKCQSLYRLIIIYGNFLLLILLSTVIFC